MEIEQPKRITKGYPWSTGTPAERLVPPAQSPGINFQGRVRVEGKFLRAGPEKFYVRGVTYGPFRPDEEGCEYHTPQQVEHDFALMAEAGINTVRTYTVPPRWLLDIASRYRLRLMVGLPWEQHVTFLDGRRQRNDIERRVREGIRACADHPAVLCFAVGNEIPASIVRWYGRRRIERWIERLYRAVKAEDPEALVTYVNFPTTEYLELPFLDLFAFNVYLESETDLRSYLARLQNQTGHRPLLMAEIGLDSMRNGEEKQAEVLGWQIAAAFSEGCCGSFVFSWTDEWHRGGFDIEDWGFGLTDRNRRPKPALDAVGRVYAETPLPRDEHRPRVSVVVCTYNGAETIEETCRHLMTLEYPDYEVIVVNDGSTDDVASRLAAFPQIRVIHQENQGLSTARNTGLAASTGEIIAYLDDDAYPDRHWLSFLVRTFQNTEHVGVGGPNLPPMGDCEVAQCVAHSPGGPNHVLLDDQLAEHIPGCNMAFRRSALESIGGFDPRFRIAGDDVDVCWRLQEKEGTLGYHSAAVVWHHPRTTLKSYLRQQCNYGRAEGILEKKWPQKYNGLGYADWRGRLYGPGGVSPLLQRWRVYHGVWGSAAFQGLYMQPMGFFQSLPLMPEWYVVIGVLMLISTAGFLWPLLFAALPLLVLAAGFPIAHAFLSAYRSMPPDDRLKKGRLKRLALVALMHMLQPAVRLKGRISYGLGPWRLRLPRLALPTSRQWAIWSEGWQAPEERLETVERALHQQRAYVERGNVFDRWDLNVLGVPLGGVRLLMAIEEHGGGQQLIRLRVRPYLGWTGLGIAGLFAAIGTVAAANGEFGAATALTGVGGLLAIGAVIGSGSAMARCLHVVQSLRQRESQPN